MKKCIVLIILSVFVFSSCNQLCKVGKKAADIIAVSMEKRWKCDYQITYDYFSKPVKDYICKDEDKFSAPGALMGAVCKITAEVLSIYTARSISEKFKCEYQLVYTDLKASGNICAILALF